MTKEGRYIERAHYYRGYVLNQASMLEKAVEQVLLHELTGEDKPNEKIQHIIFDRMTYEAKRSSLGTVLQNKAISAGFVKTKKVGFPDKPLLDELESLNKIRNQFAHYHLFLADSDEYVIALLNFRDHPTPIKYSELEVVDIISRMVAAEDKVYKIIYPL